MQIERTKAVDLFVALGLKNADKWNDARMGTKLSRIKDMVDEDVALEDEEKATLAEIMAALDAGEEIEVTRSDAEPEAEPEAEPMSQRQRDDDTSSAERASKKAGQGAAKAAAKAAEREAEKAEKEAAKAAKVAERDAKKAEKAAAKKQPLRKTVFFVCGEVVAKYGLPAGITADMIAEVVSQVKTDDAPRIAIDMKTSWHAISGYVGKPEGEIPGVNTKMETRPADAGMLYKEHGIETEVKGLIQPLNEKYGRANDTQSMYTLRNAKGAITGYLSVAEVADAVEAEEVAEEVEPSTEG